jgi:glycosyltransferase involved in cell wall biosynthesis
MNGGMDYPPAFRHAQLRLEQLGIAAGRRLARTMNGLIPGKRRAALLLVANERTRRALPQADCVPVRMLVENGVDLSLWQPKASAAHAGPARYAFVGRLVDWKAVDLLLLALARARAHAPMTLRVIGDGAERIHLETLAADLGLGAVVRFCGWLSQPECAQALRECDALVLPSLMECGGAVVLEAMAMELPVIATAWGGPLDYIDESCGVLIEPAPRERFIDALAAALVRLAVSPHERAAMGKAARAKVVREFDWEVKVERMLAIYQELARA